MFKIGVLVMDHEQGLRGILCKQDSFYTQLWHILYENGVKATAFANALEVVK